MKNKMSTSRLSRARAGGWAHKLRYLLYEQDIVARDAPRFTGLEGVMLQSNPAPDGRSANPFIARLQRATGAASSRPGAADLYGQPRRHLPLLREHPAEESYDELAAQDRCHADGQQVPAAPKSAERGGVAVLATCSTALPLAMEPARTEPRTKKPQRR